MKPSAPRTGGCVITALLLHAHLPGCAGATAASAATTHAAPATSAPAKPTPVRISSRGGTLEVTVEAPTATVWRGESLELTTSADYPGDARLQAAEAGTAALARAELGRLIRTTLVSSTVERSTTDTPETQVTQIEVAVSRALLPHVPMPTTGWARLETAQGSVLRVWARVSITRDALRAAIREAAVVAPDELDAVLHRLHLLRDGVSLVPARKPWYFASL